MAKPFIAVKSKLFAFLSLILWLATAARSARPIEVSTIPPKFRQGQCFIIRARPQAPFHSVQCTWQGKTCSLLPAGDAWEAFLPIPVNIRPGYHTIKLVAESADGTTETADHRVNILRNRFPVQRMTMKRSTLAFYTYRGVEEEYKAIRAALRLETPTRLWQGAFDIPCSGKVRTTFGSRRIINRKESHTHRGVDISAPEGAPVVASNSGTVALARDDFRLHGKTVVIDHGQGLATLYLHLSSISVSEGQAVQKGEAVGTVGHTGASTGPHLHWAFYVQEMSVDPLFIIYLTKLPELTPAPPS